MTSEQWPRTRLGDLVSIKHGWPFKSELFSEDLSGRPIIVSIGNFQYTGGFRFNSTTVKEYRGEYPSEYELTPGDVLLVMTCQTAGGEILGIPARVPDDGRTYLHNQRIGKVVLKPGAPVRDGYLYWLFLTKEFNQELVATASGTKILHTAPSRIEAFEFPLPPPAEQAAIVHVLSALNDKIDLLRRMNQTLEDTCRTLFQSWFVDFDPVRAKATGREPTGIDADVAKLLPAEVVNSEIGSIPKGWTVAALDSIADFRNGLALQKFRPDEDEERLPVVKIAQLRTGRADSGEWARADIDPACVIDNGDVIFSWSGSLTVMIWCGGRAALNQHLFKVTSTSYPKWFYLLWLFHHLPEFQRIASDKATTMGHIQRHHLTHARCVIPTRQVLDAASAVFEPLVARMVANELHMQELAETRDALLPKLLSGALRIPDPERFLKEAGV